MATVNLTMDDKVKLAVIEAAGQQNNLKIKGGDQPLKDSGKRGTDFNISATNGNAVVDVTKMRKGGSVSIDAADGTGVILKGAEIGGSQINISGTGEVVASVPKRSTNRVDDLLPVEGSSKRRGAPDVMIRIPAEDRAIAPTITFDKDTGDVNIKSNVRMSEGTDGSMILQRQNANGDFENVVTVAKGSKLSISGSDGKDMLEIDATKTLDENRKALSDYQEKAFSDIKEILGREPTPIKNQINNINTEKVPDSPNKIIVSMSDLVSKADSLAFASLKGGPSSPKGSMLPEVLEGSGPKAGGGAATPGEKVVG